MCTTAIYVRHSDEKALEKQKAGCISYCKKNNWSDFTIYCDLIVVSGLSEKTALNKLLDNIEDGKIDKLVVYSIDRLSRDQETLANFLDLLDKHNVVLYTINDDNPINISYLKIMFLKNSLKA